MPKRSPEVTAYIQAAEPFARPILRRIRKLYHEACPAIEETTKWKAPFFVHEGIVGSMSAFKKHVAIGFWKGDQLEDPARMFSKVGRTMMSMVKLASLDELPDDEVFKDYVRRAVALNVAEARGNGPSKGAQGAKRATGKRRSTVPAAATRPPADLKRALRAAPKALAAFEAFAPSHRREYVEWITEAKRDETRRRRIAQAVEWLSEGKPRNWKYMKR